MYFYTKFMYFYLTMQSMIMYNPVMLDIYFHTDNLWHKNSGGSTHRPVKGIYTVPHTRKVEAVLGFI